MLGWYMTLMNVICCDAVQTVRTEFLLKPTPLQQ